MDSTQKTTINPGRKPPGWCEEQGIDHAWELGGVLTSYPPIQTRYCANCGKVQHLRQPQWEDR